MIAMNTYGLLYALTGKRKDSVTDAPRKLRFKVFPEVLYFRFSLRVLDPVCGSKFHGFLFFMDLRLESIKRWSRL